MENEVGGAGLGPQIRMPRYDDLDLLKREKDGLWPRIWQMACRLEEIPAIGDFVEYRICDDSFLVTRTADDRIQAFYNMCRHRGRQIVQDARGNVKRWYCRFHGWQYRLDGGLAHVQDRHDWEGCPLDESALGLVEVKVALWAGWVWINQDPEAISLEEYLGDVIDILDPFEWDRGRVAWHETIIAPVNWKIVVEAFNENYHVATTHTEGWKIPPGQSRGFLHGRHAMFVLERNRVIGAAKTPEFQDLKTGEWFTPQSAVDVAWAYNRHLFDRLNSLTYEPLMAAAERLRAETRSDFPPEQVPGRLAELHREELERRGVEWPKRLDSAAIARAGTDWHIFPNSICLPTADCVLWYRVRPNGDDPDSCVFDIYNIARFAPGEEPEAHNHVSHGFEEFRGRNPFLEEDFANMEAVQRGMKTRVWNGPTFNPVQEIQIANFHRWLLSYCYGDGTDA